MSKDSLHHGADPGSDPEQLARAKLRADVGRGLKSEGKYKEALAAFDDALNMMDRTRASPADRVPVLIDLSHTNLRLGDLASSVTIAEEAMRCITTPGLPVGLKGEMTLQYGIAVSAKGDLVEGLKNLERALAFFETAGDKVGTAKTCRNIGNIHTMRSVFGKALAYYSRALKLHDELGMEKDRWYTLYNVALVKRDQALYSNAISDFEALLKFSKASDDKFLFSRSLANLGFLHMAMGKYDVALQYIDECSKVNREIGESWVEAYNVINKAELLLLKGDVQGARALISENTEAIMGTGSDETKGLALRVRGMILCAEGDHKKAEEDFALGEMVFEGRGFGVELARLYIEWARTAATAGKRSEAMALFGKARSIYRRLSLPIREKELDETLKRVGVR